LNKTGLKKDNIGVILLNLGGPDSLQAVRPFLYNLFSDRDIIRLGPSILQTPLAWLIAKIRSKKTEKYYSLIGGGSPILNITLEQARALELALNMPASVAQVTGDSNTKHPESPAEIPAQVYSVYVGMRYWHPMIDDVIPLIYKDGIRRLVALSLYPQYSFATSGSSLSYMKKILSAYDMDVTCIASWHKHPLYIKALVDVVSTGLASFNSKPGAHVLFSAHSLPQKFIEEGDPYVRQTLETIQEVMNNVSAAWHLSYQSKSGPVKWLEPSTEEKLKELAADGVKDLLMVPISFVSDHIETLYEIDILYKELAEKMGITIRRTESLNVHPLFIDGLRDIVEQRVRESGWIR
jgi:ferrochelatase